MATKPLTLSDLKGPVEIDSSKDTDPDFQAGYEYERSLAPADAPLTLADLQGDVQIEAPQAPEKGTAETFFPNTADALEDREPGIVDDLKVGLGVVGDLASMEQRVFGKLTGVTDFGDPQGGYLKGTRQRVAADNEADVARVMESNAPDWIKQTLAAGLKVGGFAGEAAINAMESPVSTALTLGTLPIARAAKAAPGLKKAALRFGSLDHAEPAVARAANPAGRVELAEAAARENPDLMAAEVRGAVEDVRTSTQDELDKAILGAAPGRKEPFARGESLYDALKEGKGLAGSKFQAEQDRTLVKSGVARGPIPKNELDDLLGRGDQKSFSKAMNKGVRGTAHDYNSAQAQVVDILKEIKYNPSKGEYGVIGNRTIGKDGIKVLKEFAESREFATAKTTQDVLNLRRLVDNKMKFGGEGGRRLFVKGSDDDFVMSALRDRLNQVVEDQFKRTIKDPVLAASLAEAWRARNAFYSDVIGTMEDVSKALPDQKQNYISALEKMDVGKLKKVMQAAQEHPKELGEVANEIRGGVVDGFLNRAMKDGKIDFKAAKKAWDDIDPELRRAMFSTNQRRDIDFALKKFSTDDANGVAGKRLGTYLSENEKTVSDKLANSAQADKRYVLKELEFLDALQGRKGKDSFAYRAKAMSQARQLGMDETGRIPKVSADKTGKFLAGPAGFSSAGAAVGGAIGGPFGAAIGALLGLGGGAVAQSPWGIVQIYRALTKLQEIEGAARKAATVTKRVTAGKAAASATRDDE